MIVDASEEAAVSSVGESSDEEVVGSLELVEVVVGAEPSVSEAELQAARANRARALARARRTGRIATL